MKFKIIQRIAKACDILIRHESHHRCAAVILAAGKGSRMNSGVSTKQFADIDGIPVIVHTLLAFEKCDAISEIVVVAAENEVQQYQEIKRKYSLHKLMAVTKGGATRALSAAHGVRRVSKECDFIAIHDGVRCLITPDEISRVVQTAYEEGAAIAAKRMTDTVKVADDKGYIRETPDRSMLWSAQTPQVFKKTIYEVALAKAKNLDQAITDDAMLVSAAGFPVKLVECEANNLKITYQGDLELAEDIMHSRKPEG